MKLPHRWSLPLWLICIFGLANSFTSIYAQTTGAMTPMFPKYKVMGVVYAPPGSASSVTYGNSTLVGSSDTITNSTSNANSTTSSYSIGLTLGPFGGSTTYTTSDEWITASSNSVAVSFQSTTGNSVSTMGPISSALGVDHDNDIIYIWLNPVVTGSYPSATDIFNWTGSYSNTCDPNSPTAPPTFYQAMSGCDPNQYPFPDIVGIPVWCLKNPYYPSESCLQWLPYTSRSWDTSPWGTDSITGLPLGPGLTMRDYADILQADPFVLLNGSEVNACHQSYGPSLDPNLSEQILAPLTPSSAVILNNGPQNGPRVNLASFALSDYTPTTDSTTSKTDPRLSLDAGTCSSSLASTAANGTTGNTAKGTTVSRFSPYGPVEYPVPGPNGLPSTYAGNFQYSSTTTDGTTATDTHTISTSISATASFGFQWGDGATGGGVDGDASTGTSSSTTWQQQSALSTTNTSGQSAAYSITGPQLSDNYAGPATYNVYLDKIYGTYAFYSDLEQSVTPANLGTIAISYINATPATVTCSPQGEVTGTTFSAAPCITFTTPQEALPFSPSNTFSANQEQLITLTNNSQFPITMTGPAVSFSDPGFQIPPSGDSCSNVQLAVGGSCPVTVLFAPVPSDAPNTISGSQYVVNAEMTVSGTVNVNSYENILVTNYSQVRGTATPNPSYLSGYTLLPSVETTPLSNSSQPNVYVFPRSTYQVGLTEQYTFTNYSSSNVAFPSKGDMILTDSADFTFLADTCAGHTVYTQAAYAANNANLDSCTITLQFLPVNPAPTSAGYSTSITATSNAGVSLAVAGAAGTAITPISVTQYTGFTSPITIPMAVQTPSAYYTEQWAVPIVINNVTSASVNIGTNTQPLSITDSNGTYTCQIAQGIGNEYFSPCVTASVNPSGYAWEYIFGQLSGYLVDTTGQPNLGYPTEPADTNNGEPNAGYTEEGHGRSCYNEPNPTSPVTPWTGCVPGISTAYQTAEGQSNISIPLTCTASLAAGSSCVAAVVAYLPDLPSNSEVWAIGGPYSFNLPLSGTVGSSAVPFSISTPVNVTVGAAPTTIIADVSGVEKSSTAKAAATPSTGTLTLREVSSESASAKVGSFMATASYLPGATPAVAAQSLAKALNAAGSPVKATANGSVITLTSSGTGSKENIALAASGNALFSLKASGKSLTGGKDAVMTIKYDTGRVSLVAHDRTAVADWKSGSTPQSLATVLAASVNEVVPAYWKASAVGNVVSLTPVSAKSSGAVEVSVADTAGFTSLSFSASSKESGTKTQIVISGAEKNTPVQVAAATPASGTLTLDEVTSEAISAKVGSFTATASIAPQTTPAAAAQALAKALNVSASPVKATVSGSVITLTSLATGSKENLNIAATGNAEFTLKASGSALTGGKDAVTSTVYDTGTIALSSYGITAMADWTSKSTPQSVATALAASVNKTASAYWKATAAGAKVILVSVPTTTSNSVKQETASSSGTLQVTVTDTAGFNPESFSVSTSNQ